MENPTNRNYQPPMPWGPVDPPRQAVGPMPWDGWAESSAEDTRRLVDEYQRLHG